MVNTRQVTRRITTAQNISKITKAMEMVAASKMKRAQDQALAARPYSVALTHSLRMISGMVDATLHPLLSVNDEGSPVVVVIATDRGLCGSLNAHLTKQLIAWKAKHPPGQVIAVGRKAVLFTRSIGMTLHAQFIDLPEKIKTVDVVSLSALVINGFLEKKYLSVDLIYMNFINTLSQKVEQEQLLPLTSLEEEIKTGKKEICKEYVFEPSPKRILNELLPFYIENTIFHSMLESKASEHSSRMVAMKNASENAADLVKELKLIFNKSRQQNITSELLEITTATMALS